MHCHYEANERGTKNRGAVNIVALTVDNLIVTIQIPARWSSEKKPLVADATIFYCAGTWGLQICSDHLTVSFNFHPHPLIDPFLRGRTRGTQLLLVTIISYDNVHFVREPVGVWRCLVAFARGAHMGLYAAACRATGDHKVTETIVMACWLCHLLAADLTWVSVWGGERGERGRGQDSRYGRRAV